MLMLRPYYTDFLDLLALSSKITSVGAVAELADAADLKSAGSDTLWVQVPPALQI